MSAALIWLCLIGLLAWIWLDGARARELATGLVEEVCRKRGLQFLDGTVSLQRMGLRRGSNGGLRVRRMFSFDFSLEGTGRRRGYVILLGTKVETIDLGLPRSPSATNPESNAAKDTSDSVPSQTENPSEQKVVPFRRPPKR